MKAIAFLGDINRTKPALLAALSAPIKKSVYGPARSCPLRRFYQAVNKVEPTLIRVEADELTYSLHVILRFELEVALIEGSLSVRDIPEAWNAKMEELLGIKPSNKQRGLFTRRTLVDWCFWIFPTYTLGNLYASHLFLGFEKSNPEWKERVAKGDLAFITEWLSQTVYRHGRHYTSKELLKQISGKDFTSKAFIDYLTAKY